MSVTTAPPRSRWRGPLASPSYRLLVTAQTVNAFGSAITPVALAFAVIDLGGSATQLGLVVAAFSAAEVATTLFGGVLGDRVSRAVMLQGSNTLSAVVQGLVAASLVGGWSSIWLLGVLGAVDGCVSALGRPSSQAITQQTVPAEQLSAAISLRRIGQNTAVALGFSVAGVLVSAFGAGWAIGIDAVTFAFAALCFARLTVPALPAPAHESMLVGLRAGAAEVFRHAWLWVLIGQALVYHLFYGGAQGVLGPFVVKRHYGEAAWGWALGALMLGFIVGGVVTLRFRPRRSLFTGTVMLALTALFPLALALHPVLPLLLAGAFLHGLGLAVTGVVAQATGYSVWLLVVAAVMAGSTLLALTVPSVRRLERRTRRPSPQASRREGRGRAGRRAAAPAR